MQPLGESGDGCAGFRALYFVVAPVEIEGLDVEGGFVLALVSDLKAGAPEGIKSVMGVFYSSWTPWSLLRPFCTASRSRPRLSSRLASTSSA